MDNFFDKIFVVKFGGYENYSYFCIALEKKSLSIRGVAQSG